MQSYSSRAYGICQMDILETPSSISRQNKLQKWIQCRNQREDRYPGYCMMCEAFFLYSFATNLCAPKCFCQILKPLNFISILRCLEHSLQYIFVFSENCVEFQFYLPQLFIPTLYLCSQCSIYGTVDKGPTSVP